MSDVAIWRIHTGVESENWREDRRTYDDAATEVLGRIEDPSGDTGAQPLGPLRENGEEGAEERSREDDEDGGDAEASIAAVAATRAAVDIVVVVAGEKASVAHLEQVGRVKCSDVGCGRRGGLI